MPTTELVPFRMDASNQAGWWSPIDRFDGETYVAYNAWGGPGAANDGPDDTHTVYVARRTSNGTWSRGCMPAGAGGCRVFGDDIGHNQPSIAVDGSGSIHVFTAMHGDDWIYYRASAAAGLDGFGDRSHEMPGFGSARITYPNLTRAANGDLYLIVRDLTSGKLYRWNNATNAWSLVTVFAREAGFSVYPDDVRATSDGQIHIAWEWAGGGAGALRHLGSYMRHDPTTGNFYNAAGQQLTVPVTTNTSPTYAPLGRGESKTGGGDDPGVQTAKITIDPSTRRPVACYRYRSVEGGPFRVRYAAWNGASWNRVTVYNGRYDTFAAVDVTLLNGVPRVYYVKADTAQGDQAFVSERQTDGSWTETLLLSRVRVERLSIVRDLNTDHLYLSAPDSRDLFYGTHSW
jgi:hypothetical protein